MMVDQPAFARYPAAAHAYGVQTGLIPSPTVEDALSGVASIAALSPAAAAAHILGRKRAMHGLGSDVGETLLVVGGVTLAVVLGAAALVGYAGYTYGKHVAPPGKEKEYGIVGALSGLAFGPLGLGVLGAVSDR